MRQVKWITALLIVLVGVEVRAQQPTAPPAPPTPAKEGLFKPTFLLANESWSAGTAFIVRGGDGKSAVLVTCHHLFGPAAGLEKQMSPEEIARDGRGAVALSMQDQKLIVVAPTYLKVADVRAMDRQGTDKDMALFAVKDGEKLAAFEMAEKAANVGDVVYLFARARGADAPKLYRATVVESAANGLSYQFDETFDARGTSGAPVLDAQGKVVGMNLGGGDVQGKQIGIANPGTSVRQAIQAAAKQ